MGEKLALVLYYRKANRYAFNALLASLETELFSEKLKIFLPRNTGELLETLREVDANLEVKRIVLGISFMSTQIWEISELVHKLKLQKTGKLFMVAGGPHPTGDPVGTLNMGFDMVVLGEGERTFTELMKTLYSEEDPYRIEGIAYLQDGKLKVNPRRGFLNLNSFPPLPKKVRVFGPIEITRGCPYRCYFCQTSYMFGKIVRHRDVELIIEQVKYLKQAGKTDIRFITPNALSYGSRDGKTVNLEALAELLEGVRKVLGREGRIFFGTFPSEIRPEHITADTLKLMRKFVDNDNLVIGAQSGSPRILKLCNRGHTVDDVYRAVDLSLRFGFKPNVDFIFGLPGETQEDIELTLKMLEEITAMGARIHAHVFIPLPQTPFATASAPALGDNLIRRLELLTSKGKLYGEWRKQVELSERLSRYLKERLYMSRRIR